MAGKSPDDLDEFGWLTMLQKCETPRDGGVSRNSCGGCFRDFLSPTVCRVQFLTYIHQVRPEVAVMVAAMTFGTGDGHG